MSRTRPKALITHASCAIGLVYADRLVRRGYDLVLLTHHRERPATLARDLRRETGAAIDVSVTDLTREHGLQDVEAALAGVDLIVNNLELPSAGLLAQGHTSGLDRLLDVNIKAYARLAAAAAASMAGRRQGAIVNVVSALGLAPGIATGAYGATMAFAIALTRTMQAELSSDSVYVQLVIAAATRTDVWPIGNSPPELLPGVMSPRDFVDAAMTGFDLREPITIPSLAEIGSWERYEDARNALLFDIVSSDPAPRYRKWG